MLLMVFSENVVFAIEIKIKKGSRFFFHVKGCFLWDMKKLSNNGGGLLKFRNHDTFEEKSKNLKKTKIDQEE